MLELFQRVARSPNAQRMPAEFEYIKGTYLRELLTIQDYYNNRVYAVKNQHFLVRLLTHVDTPMQYELDRFIESTRARAPYIAKAFRMTSDIETGAVHHGAFYGVGSHEVIIYEDSYFDASYAERNWQRINAVSTIWHPKSDLGFMLGNGRSSGTDTGFSVISINIPLLAVQLRCFLRDQLLRRQLLDGGMLGITHFVHMYVLPNMLYRHTDIVVMNRLMRLLYDVEMGEARFKHPFPVVDYATKLDGVLLKLTEDYYDKNMAYEWLLSALPSISGRDMAESLQLPEIAPTRQVWWAVTLSRTTVMKYLIDLGGVSSVRRNQQLINRMQRDIRRLRRDSVLANVLPKEQLTETNDLLDALLDT